jgi:hypothetical protein
MKFGQYTDKGLPTAVKMDKQLYKLNSHGYRCPEWDPMPNGKKNVAILGCSHTFGQGLNEDEHWVHFLSQHNTQRLRYWNLGQPGASADKIVRILYGSEKIIYPKIIVVCWPEWSRRERLGDFPESLPGTDETLRFEDSGTDEHNFLKNVFFVEKFAEKNSATVLHCFAHDTYHKSLSGNNVLEEQTLMNCWPYWDRFNPMDETNEPSYARDGVHYGVEHHRRFADLLIERFGHKLK